MQLAINSGPAAAALSCPTCAGPVDVSSKHVAVQGSSVRIFCSGDCLERALAGLPAAEMVAAGPPRKRKSIYPVATGGALIGLFIGSTHHWLEPPPVKQAVIEARVALPAEPVEALQPTEPPPPEKVYGPAWPPTDDELRSEISRDAWLHPLPGPIRRMPIRDSRVFGADRPGADTRPVECVNGHCGVDIGGEIWGEPVLAAHDGEVDFVQRGANPLRGGHYVRLAHRGGMVYTQYFHLAAIPPWIKVGRAIKAGDMIGLVGDTGAERSGSHLHFTISVKPAPSLPERYIDPEPLIALWPLKIPVANGSGGLLSIDSAPGMVRGAAYRKRRSGRRNRGTAHGDAVESAPAAATSSGGDTPAPEQSDDPGVN